MNKEPIAQSSPKARITIAASASRSWKRAAPCAPLSLSVSRMPAACSDQPSHHCLTLRKCVRFRSPVVAFLNELGKHSGSVSMHPLRFAADSTTGYITPAQALETTFWPIAAWGQQSSRPETGTTSRQPVVGHHGRSWRFSQSKRWSPPSLELANKPSSAARRAANPSGTRVR